MARIYGIDIPDNKLLVVALTYIYGIGNTTAHDIMRHFKYDPLKKKAGELTADDITSIEKYLRGDFKKLLEADLRREVQQNIDILKDIRSYRGTRHTMRLPVRGQKTRTNARTRKGKKKTVAGKKG